ncbi:MAG: hypothetical protein AAFR29_06680, partial [Pseudomonadota bacterium]
NMKTLLNLLFWFPLAIIGVAFLTANRALMSVSLNPFADGSDFLTSPPLPMWVWLIMMLFIGLALGSMGMYSSNAPNRQKARALKAELRSVRAELASIREAEPSGDNLPVLQSAD